MAKKGHGRRSRDLPAFSAEQLEQVEQWLSDRIEQLRQGGRRCAEGYRLTRDARMAVNALYYTNAARGGAWIKQQLRYTIDARRVQEKESSRAAGRDAGRRQ